MQKYCKEYGNLDCIEFPASALNRQLRDSLVDTLAGLSLLVAHCDDIGGDYCERLQRSAYSMLRIACNSEMASELAGIDIDMAPVDMTSLVNAIRNAASLTIRDTPIIGTSECDHLIVKANKDVLVHIIIELLRNSLQYTQDNNTVSLDLFKHGNNAILQIKDRGLGIKRMHQPYIFDPYYSIDPYGDNPVSPGLGVGLYLLYRAIQHFGGSVTAVSEFGKGSTFVISIPLFSTSDEIEILAEADLLLNRYSPLYISLSSYINSLPSL